MTQDLWQIILLKVFFQSFPALSAIPEGLPTVVTIILSIGVTAMSKRQALIRKLTAVETLGCTQIIYSDKTGTLTQNKMTVVDHFGDNEKLIAEAMALCTDAQIDDAGNVTGEPAEAALVGYAYALGMSKNDLVKASPRIGEAPFDSGRKMMSTVHKTASGIVQYTKGAPDVVINLCKTALIDDRIVPMDDEFRAKIAADNKRMADKALRVLAVALRNYDSVPASFEPEALENDLVFVGLTGMIDPVRPEVKAAIEECRGAGITPIMITGDHKDTAVAIGRELGIISDASQAILGAGFDMAWQGIYLAIVELAAYVIGYRLEVGSFENMFFGGADGYCINAMSMAFLTVNFAEMMCAINMRSRTGSIFSKSMFKNMNWWLVGSFVVTTALTLIAVYLPGLSDEVFDIERGTFQTNELLISAGLAASTIPVFEIGKAIRRAVERKKERNAA